MYLDQIYALDQNSDRDKIFKYLVAMEENLLMWDDISNQVQEKYGLPTNEYLGADMMSQDLDQSTNAVYSGSVSWKDLGMFINFNALVLGNTDAILVVNKNIQVDDMVRRVVNVKVYDYDQLWDRYTRVPMKSARSGLASNNFTS